MKVAHKIKPLPKPMTPKSGNNPLAPEQSKNPQGVFSSFPATVPNQNSVRIKDERPALSKRWGIIHTPVFWVPLIFTRSLTLLQKLAFLARNSPRGNVFPQPLAMVTARGTKIKSILLCSHRRTINKINQQSLSSLVLDFLPGLSLLSFLNQLVMST